MTDHLMSNSETQQDNFFYILRDLLARKSGPMKNTLLIPTSKSTANAVLLEGKYGLFGNLPIVEPKHIGNTHACISLVKLIKHLMAHRIPIAFSEWPDNDQGSQSTRRRHGVFGTPAMDALLKKLKQMNQSSEPTHYGHFILWSDGFLRSFVKQKDNSVWILTVTLPDPKEESTSKFHTQVIAIGKSSEDHTAVLEYYYGEIEALMKGIIVFDGVDGTFKRVCFGCLAYVADRPERSSILKISHLGIWGKRSLWCTPIDHKTLPYCNRCFKMEIEDILSDPFGNSCLRRCHRCCQWDMTSDSNANKKFDAPPNYPTVADVNAPRPPLGRSIGDNFMIPIFLTFQWLISAVQFAAHNVKAKAWNKTVMRAYLISCSVPKIVRENVWKKSQGEDADVSSIIPSVWQSEIPTDAWIDTGMHHIFHGVVADIMDQSEKFMSDHRLKSDFETLVYSDLRELQTLRLEWCCVRSLPRKQWLAEDELGFTRILPFVYGMFFRFLQLPESSNTSSMTLIALQQLYVSLYVMVAMLMSPREPNTNAIIRHSKIFLSCCDRFSKSYHDSECEPFWSTTGNFPSLLNLGEQIRKYGPIRWYWEGTRERFIQSVKRVLVSMRKTQLYFSRKLTVIQKLYVMEWLKLRAGDGTQSNQENYVRSYYRYESLTEIEQLFNSGKIISGFTLKKRCDHIFVAFGVKGEKMSIVGVSLDDFTTSEIFCGFTYGKLRLCSDRVPNPMSRKGLERKMSGYCLLLPLRKKNLDFKRKYAIVYSDWDVQVSHPNGKGLPTISKEVFAQDVSQS